MRKVVKVQALAGYRLALEFDNGVSANVDLSHLVGKGVFALWQDPGVFEQVRVGSSGELVWCDQLDLCPDTLYLKATNPEPEEAFGAAGREEPVRA